jgi:hypothetical protein
MIEKCKTILTFCVEHWKEIGITSIAIHLLLHELPLLIMFLFGIELFGHGH